MCHRCFTKYAWVKPLKDEKGKRVLNAFTEVVNESNLKSNKLEVNQGRDYNKFNYNKLMQEWLYNNNILMYSTHNEGNSIITESVIKILKPKVYTKMTANDSRSIQQ